MFERKRTGECDVCGRTGVIGDADPTGRLYHCKQCGHTFCNQCYLSGTPAKTALKQLISQEKRRSLGRPVCPFCGAKLPMFFIG